MTEQEKEDLKETKTEDKDSEEIASGQEMETSAEAVQEEAAEAVQEDEAKENPENAEESSEEGAGETQGGMSWAEKRAAKKQAKQDKKEDAYKEKIEQLEDRVRRQLAEFENFRTRSEREKQAMFEMGAKSIIEKMLPIVDNFERGLDTVAAEDKEKPFVGGMNLVYRQLMTELDNLGVKPIEAVGKEFDPNFHNAVTQVESEEYESGIVAQELQKGYTYHGTVVRHSMVAVTI
ncbi:MAG: nucleotide exchange factor GrpE [Bacteroidales bacterium]|nr:nucleotide exchange factor GrpE [Lachnoclostridium sp.]MCM1383220.1 nucleotide exchange factor GrpE [Lachnoclostridium sp.]MCM1464555.1 nucleotide exchange factor GrpE [Bacteroidales bacterium]